MTSPSSWSVAQVVQWLGKNECSEETLRACESNKVDGSTLLGLSKSDIKEELEISSIADRKKLWALVEGLIQASANEKQVSPERLVRPITPPSLHSPAAGSGGSLGRGPLHSPSAHVAGSPVKSLRRSSLAESLGASEIGDLDALEEWSKRLWADDKMRQDAVVEAARRQAHREAIAKQERERKKAEDLRVADQIQKDADARYQEKVVRETEEERIAEAGKRLRSRRSLTPSDTTDNVPSWKARELADADAVAKDKVRPHTPPPVERTPSAAAEAQKAREQLRAEERQQRMVQVSKQHRDAVFEEERRRRTQNQALDAAERNRREAMRREMQRRQEKVAMEAARRLPPMQGTKTAAAPEIAMVPGMPVRTALGDAWIVERYSGGNPKLRDFWWVEMQDGTECLFGAGGIVPRRGGAVRS